MGGFGEDGDGDGYGGEDEVEDGDETPEGERENVGDQDLVRRLALGLVPAHIKAGIVSVKPGTQSGDA